MKIFSGLMVLALVTVSDTGAAADLYAPSAIENPENSACANQDVLAGIMDRFAWVERTLWHRGFTMERIDNPRPSGHPFAEPGLVKRDYCVADSVMTNGSAHPVYFAIESGLGFASIGDYVNFCVLGLDPWSVHDGACRTVR